MRFICKQLQLKCRTLIFAVVEMAKKTLQGSFEKSKKVVSSKLFFLVFLVKHCFKTEGASVNYEVLTNIRPVDCDRAFLYDLGLYHIGCI